MTRPPTGRLAGLRALIVDDNQTNRLILSEQLGAWGVRTDAVQDGATALRVLLQAAADAEPYDLRPSGLLHAADGRTGAGYANLS